MLPEMSINVAHWLSIHNDHVHISGFEGIDERKCFCIVAKGCRYLEYGISNGSILLCCGDVEVEDGDLVMVQEKKRLAIYQYRTDLAIKADGEKRILHDASAIHSKILCSFNFYH